MPSRGFTRGRGRCALGLSHQWWGQLRQASRFPTRRPRGGCESSCAAEAAARRLPLKRQCCARLRADAEPRVYPRTGAMRSGLESPVVGSIAPGFEISDSKAQGRHRPFTGNAEPRVYPRTYDSAVPGATISLVQQRSRPFDDLSQVERFLEDGTGIVLEPGAY